VRPVEEQPPPDRPRGAPVQRTGLLLALLISGCLAMGYAIYWLLRTGRY
jgi:hypothetical protein